MFTLLLSATRIIWLKRFRCAFRTTFWPLIWYDFALIVENVFSLCFVVLSWNFTDGGSSSNMVRLNDWYASSPTSNALRRSLTTADGSTVPVDRLTRSDSLGDNLQINQRLGPCSHCHSCAGTVPICRISRVCERAMSAIKLDLISEN